MVAEVSDPELLRHGRAAGDDSVEDEWGLNAVNDEAMNGTRTRGAVELCFGMQVAGGLEGEHGVILHHPSAGGWFELHRYGTLGVRPDALLAALVSDLEARDPFLRLNASSNPLRKCLRCVIGYGEPLLGARLGERELFGTYLDASFGSGIPGIASGSRGACVASRCRERLSTASTDSGDGKSRQHYRQGESVLMHVSSFLGMR